MKRKIGILIFLALAAGGSLLAQSQPAPLTEKELVDLIRQNKKDLQPASKEVTGRGVDFELDSDIEKKLRKAGADDPLIEVIKNAGPAARAAQKSQLTGQGPGQQLQGSPEEIQAYQAIQTELDPDREVQMVTDFEKKFPNSAQLSYAYAFAANAYQQKGEIERVVEYGAKSLKLKEDNLPSLIIMADMLPQPQMMRGNEIDKEKKLAEAEKYANRALQLIEQLPRQPNETDEQFQKRKTQISTEPHSALGMVHLQRSAMALEAPDPDELAKAAQEYKTAVSLADRPNPQDYYRLGEAYGLLKKLDEAMEAFSKASELGQGTVLKTYADERIEDLKKRKSQGTSPAKP